MKSTPRLLLSLAALVLFGNATVIAQTDAALLRDLSEENKKSVEALVLYPSDTRLAILEAAKHPEILIKMEVRGRQPAAPRTNPLPVPKTEKAPSKARKGSGN